MELLKMLQKVEKPKRGRPSKYNDRLADRICMGIARGKALATVCSAKGMPNPDTVYSWLSTQPNFPEKYARARSDGMEARADKIEEIADNCDASDPAAVNKARLQVDTRKWLMSKIAPKKYGDRVVQELTGPNGAPIMIERVYFSEPPVKTIEGSVERSSTDPLDDGGTGRKPL